MITPEFHITEWVLNWPAIFITLGLIMFHLGTVGFRFKPNSSYYVAGILLFVIMTMSPIESLGMTYLFSAHMVQHIFFLLIIPPLLLAGTDAAFLNRVFSKSGWTTLGRMIFYPLVTWVLGIGTMWISHIPIVFEVMKHSQAMMAGQITASLILGYIFIWPVFAPIKFMRLSPLESSLYLFSACVGCTVLGIFITFAPAGLYSSFFIGGNPAVGELITGKWGITSAVDQQMAGLIMWVPACIVYVTNIMIILGKWYMRSAGSSIEESGI